MPQNNSQAAALRGRTATHHRSVRAAARCACEPLEARRLLAAAVPEQVKEINTIPQGSDPGPFTAVGDVVFFAASDADAGRELWRTDGTAAGTVRVKDIAPGPGGSSPVNLTDVNGTLFFLALDAGGEHDLWKSDGTTAGTVMVADLGEDDYSYYWTYYRIDPHWMAVAGGTLYFTADGNGGQELWRSDGTAAGTVRVKDIFPGKGYSSPSDLTDVKGTLYFAATDPGGGRELWRSDGTAAGTVRVADLNPGFAGSKPGELAVAGGMLYFAAENPAGNRELWKLDLTAPPPATVVGRYAFYNNSSFDDRDRAASAADDGAIATDKAALLPGQSPSFANITSYTRGLNGIMLDVAGLPPDAVLTANDFTIRTGRSIAPDTFVAGPVPLAVTVRRGAGANGSDRITLTWRDHGRTNRSGGPRAVANGWLEVTLKANANTCLVAPDVFYFGNFVGDTGDQPHQAVVGAADFVRTRQNFTRSAEVTSWFDHDRDGRVSGTDLAAVLANKHGEKVVVPARRQTRTPRHIRGD